MVKKILICSMCAMLLLGVSALAEGEMPQGNPPSNMEIPEGMPPEGMKPPEGAELPEGMEFPNGMGRPEGMPENTDGFPRGGQADIPQEVTENTQTEGMQPSEETAENAEELQQPEGEQVTEETTGNTEEPQGQEAEQAARPDMGNFGGGGRDFGGFSRGNMQTIEKEPLTFTGFLKEYQTPVMSILLLIVAFVFVKLYKRKNY